MAGATGNLIEGLAGGGAKSVKQVVTGKANIADKIGAAGQARDTEKFGNDVANTLKDPEKNSVIKVDSLTKLTKITKKLINRMPIFIKVPLIIILVWIVWNYKTINYGISEDQLKSVNQGGIVLS